MNELQSNELEVESLLEKSEKEFEVKKLWYEYLLESFHETPISVTDMNKNIAFINKAGLKILGKTREEIIGKYCGDVWGLDICGESCEIEHKCGNENNVFNVSDKTHTIFSSYIKDKDGNNIGLIQVVSDITDPTILRK